MGVVKDILEHGWNVFRKRDPTTPEYKYGLTYGNPAVPRLKRRNTRTQASTILTKIAIDVAMTDIKHIKEDPETGLYIEDVKSPLNECLTVSANIDQTGRNLILDAVMKMMDKGVVAIVPVETTVDPEITNGWYPTSLRCGEVVQWYPKHVGVMLYNEEEGQKEMVTVPKDMCAIVINPFYNIMNEPNSLGYRLTEKIELLDQVDQASGAGNLDIIIQLPYSIKNPVRKKEAEERRKQIEQQLTNSKYGIAYIDATEHITQLNRPSENNLLAQIELLQKELYSTFGITEDVFNGVATPEQMQAYYQRTVIPFVIAIVEEMRRKWLTKTARTQGHDIGYYYNPFRFSTLQQIAEAGDALTRNEIMSSNEFRRVLGLKASDSERANELQNKNLNPSEFTGGFEEEEIDVEDEPLPGDPGYDDEEE